MSKRKYDIEYINDDSIKRKINALKNEKMKLALRLQLKSGLRIKEIAELEKGDVVFNDDGTMTLSVRKGKSDKDHKEKPRTVQVRNDEYLYDKLKSFIGNSEDGRLFYSRNYMRCTAHKYNIATHDLRRINAQERMIDLIDDGKKRMDAKENVSEELGHTHVKMTNAYLNKKRITSKKVRGKVVKGNKK